MKYKLIIDKHKEEEITIRVHAPSKLTEKIENLINSYTGIDYLVGFKENEIRKLLFKEIECITIIERKVIAIDRKGNQYRIQERLRDLENILPTYFIRINKSSLANEHCIKCFNATYNGGINAIFTCGYTEYVSRRCFSEIRRRFEK